MNVLDKDICFHYH